MPALEVTTPAIPRFETEEEMTQWVENLTDDEVEALYQEYAPTSSAEWQYNESVFDEAWERVRQAYSAAPVLAPTRRSSRARICPANPVLSACAGFVSRPRGDVSTNLSSHNWC